MTLHMGRRCIPRTLRMTQVSRADVQCSAQRTECRLHYTIA